MTKVSTARVARSFVPQSVQLINSQDGGIVSSMAEKQTTLFDVSVDRFQCITVKSTSVTFDSDEDFEVKLHASMSKWQSKGVRGVWVQAAIQHASLVPVCTKMGFVFHHAQENYVMMKKWLSTTEPDNLPQYANQTLGCGGFVVNKRNQVLVIQEKYHLKKHWKLPGGIADTGEDIGTAACRETFEETGVRCEFQGVICFRHQHQFRFGCSDFYFICLLKPLTEQIRKCDHEIERAQWMDLEEYASHPDVAGPNRYFAQCYLDMKQHGQDMIQAQPVLSFAGNTHHLVYSIKPVQQEEAVSNELPGVTA